MSVPICKMHDPIWHLILTAYWWI